MSQSIATAAPKTSAPWATTLHGVGFDYQPSGMSVYPKIKKVKTVVLGMKDAAFIENITEAQLREYFPKSEFVQFGNSDTMVDAYTNVLNRLADDMFDTKPAQKSKLDVSTPEPLSLTLTQHNAGFGIVVIMGFDIVSVKTVDDSDPTAKHVCRRDEDGDYHYRGTTINKYNRQFHPMGRQYGSYDTLASAKSNIDQSWKQTLIKREQRKQQPAA